MNLLGQIPVLIYDGDCAFCAASVRVLERRVRRHPRCAPWQQLDLEVLGVSRTDCEQAVQFVDGDGNVHAAERAVARVLIEAGSGWAIIGRTLLAPGIRPVAGVLYKWVAKNRHRLPGGTAQCSIADRPRDDASQEPELLGDSNR